MFCLICGQLKHTSDFIIYKGGAMCIKCYREVKELVSDYWFKQKYGKSKDKNKK